MKRLLSLVLCLVSFNVFSGIDEGRAWLDSKVQTDGGVYQSQEIALPIQATSESVKLSPSLLIDIAAAKNYLKSQVTISNRTEFIARTIISGLTTDENTQNLTSRLLLSLNRDGGFGSHQFGDSNAFDTAWALLALSQVNLNHESISSALFYLNGSVNSDGGWGYPDDESSVFVSALVLNAISKFRQQFNLASLINPLESYLLTSRSNGLWSEDFVSAQVLISLQQSLPDAVGISESVTALRARQLTNGSWSNDVFTTALALQALGVTADIPIATQTGFITGLVLDGLTGNPLQGATVSVAGIVNKNVVTTSDGEFSLPDLPAGSYQLAVSLNGYNNVSGSAQLSAGQRADFGTIRLNQGENPTTATIYGQVTDSETGLPLGGSSILLEGPGVSVTTNADGNYQLSGVAPQTLTVIITRTGYSSATSTLDLSAGGLYVISPALTPTATETTALQGIVTDGVTGLPLIGASIVISGSDADSVDSGADGSYFIGDINPGNINVIVSLAGYDSVLATATLFENNILPFSPKLFPTNTAPPNNSDATVSGIVIDSTTNQPLAGVSVFATFGSQTLSVLSAEDGSFSVEGLSELQGSVQFSLVGFNNASYGLDLDPLSIFSLGQVRLNPVGASELLSDLMVNLIDNTIVTTDPETLQVSGDLLVEVGNAGTAPATAGVEVTAFYDVDKNDIYDQNTDILLATVTTIAELVVGDSEQIILSLQGELPYRDALIKVWVDSLQTTVELNELNNIGNTADYCGLDITDIEMPYVYYGRNVGEENPNPQNSALNVVGVQNETIYTVTDLATNNVVFSGVINRLETIEIALEGVHLFKFESNKPAQILVHGIYLSVDQTYGSYFYLDDNGQDYYGHRFTFFAHLGRANDHYVFAKIDSRVEVKDESDVVISTVDLLANQYWRIPNINPEQVHTIVSTGEVAVESVTYNSFSIVPPASSINCVDDCISSKGNRFFFGTRGDSVGDGAAAITNTSPIEVVYSLTRMSDGHIFRDEVTLLPEERHYIPGLGTSAFSLEVTGGDAIVLAGSTERGQGIEHIGDDLSPLLLEANEEVSLNTQTAGIIIFSAYDNTQIQFGNGSVVTLNRDEFFSVGPFQETTFSTTNSSIVLLAGGTCCEVFNDWGSTLRAIVKRPLSDLTLSSLQFSTQAIVGNQLSVKVGNNRQDIFESQSTVSFFEGDPASGGTLIGTVDVPVIPSDSYQNVILQDVELTGGSDIFAVVDYEGLLQECNELNNSMHIPAPDLIPDLIINSVDSSNVVSDPVSLGMSGIARVNVVNGGMADSVASFDVSSFYDENNNSILDVGEHIFGISRIDSGLARGSSIAVDISITGEAPFRDAPLTFWVDSAQEIQESLENNNQSVSVCSSCMVFSDSFDFYDTDKWTEIPNHLGSTSLWSVVDGVYSANVSGGAAFAGDISWQDYIAETKIVFPDGASNDAALMFRYQDVNNWYQLRLRDGEIRILAFIDGEIIPVTRATVSVLPQTAYSLRVDVRGDRVLAYLDDELIFDYVGLQLSNGAVGYYDDGVAVQYDDLHVEICDKNLPDINNWSTQSLLGGDQGNWQQSSNGTSVSQTSSSKQSLVISDLVFEQHEIEFDVELAPTSGEGEIGFAFGYESVNQFYHFRWVSANSPGGCDCIQLLKFDPVTSPGIPIELYHQSGLGWETGDKYSISLSFYNGNSHINVYESSQLLLSIPYASSEFQSGRFGFYSDAAALVEYKLRSFKEYGDIDVSVGKLEVQQSSGGNILAARIGKVEEVSSPFTEQVINLLASDPNNVITLDLGPGKYLVTPLRQSEGATFSAYTKNASVAGCDTNGENCTDGWSTGFWLLSPSLLFDPVYRETSAYKANFSDELVASTNAYKTYFTLTKDEAVSFSIRDVDFSDNLGGLSLKIEKLEDISRQTSVSFYSGDPSLGAALLDTVTTNISAAIGFQDVTLSNINIPAGVTDIFAVVDADNLLDECDETNNQVSIPVPLSQLAQLQVKTNSLVYGANDSILLSGVITNLSELTGDFSVSLQVEDINGVVVTTFNNLPVATLAGGSAVQLDQLWGATSIVAANYTLRGSLLNNSGDVLDTALSQFEIRQTVIGDAALTLRTRTDKPEYNTTDTVQLENLVRNVTGNTLVDGALLNLSVSNPSGNEIFNQVFNLNNLGPNGIDQTFSALSLPAAPQGTYTVRGEVRDAIGNVLATDSASFSVTQDQRVALTGSVSAQFSQIEAGGLQSCANQITNQGNDGATDFTVRQLLTNISSQTVISTNSQGINISTDSSANLNHTISTQDLVHGFYSCVLQVDVNGEWVTLGADSFEVINRSPIANAGAYQGVTAGTIVNLDGSQSADPDGDEITYQWTLVSAPATSVTTLTNGADVNPSLLLDARGNYEIQLTISDGELSHTDVVIVEALNNIPLANAGNDQIANIGNVITLDGSASSDIDGDALTYRWQILQQPANSNSVLPDPNAIMPQITIDVQGSYVLELIVNDGIDDGVADTVVLTINNIRPVADAGIDQSGFVSDSITLDGSNSSDIDGDNLTYFWTIVAAPQNSNAALNNAASIMPVLNLDASGEYQIQLIVNDGFEDSDPDLVTVTTLNTRPVADAGLDQAVIVNDIVDLNGLGSFDADGDDLVYQWNIVGQPGNSTAEIFGANTGSPNIAIDVPGVYVIQLIVNDGQDNSDPDTIVITTQNVRPIAEAGDPQQTNINEVVSLNGSESSDPDGDAITYQWSVISEPSGSSVSIDDATLVTPSFIPVTEGMYVLQLVVSDGELSALPDTVNITVVNPTPTLDCSITDAYPNTLWPPNHKFQEITISGFPSDTLIDVSSITQDEPVGKTKGHHNKHHSSSHKNKGKSKNKRGGKGKSKYSPDAKIIEGEEDESDRIYLRRERNGSLHNGRVYQINFNAYTPDGEECSGSVNVVVPHDQSHPVVDDGQDYNSLGESHPHSRPKKPKHGHKKPKHGHHDNHRDHSHDNKKNGNKNSKGKDKKPKHSTHKNFRK